jgi:hypothetical protein
VVSSGVFRLNIVRFTIAIAAGRTFAICSRANLAAHITATTQKKYLAHYYPTIGITLALADNCVLYRAAFLRQSPEERAIRRRKANCNSPLGSFVWNRRASDSVLIPFSQDSRAVAGNTRAVASAVIGGAMTARGMPI